MPSEKPPAFQFYPKDFLSSDSVSLMTTEQIGAYTLLLCHSWLRPEGLPADQDSLARLARVPVARFTSKVWPGISRSFTPNADGLLCNPRMERGRIEQDSYRAERSQSGKRGAASRWAGKHDGLVNGSVILKPLTKNSSSSASASADQEPPNPPHGGGLSKPMTRAERKMAETVRHSWAGWCRHDPECPRGDSITCLTRIVVERREREQAALAEAAGVPA